MKSRIFIMLIFGVSMANAQTQLFLEDFNDEALNNGTGGTSVGGTWTVTTTPSAAFATQERIFEPVFTANQTVTERVFETSPIDISGTGMATISVLFRTIFSNSTDYLRAYYKVDGGPEILFHEFLGQFLDITVQGSAIVAGNSLQIVIRGMENTAGDIPLVNIPIALSFDDLEVTSVPVLYSCNNSATVFTGDWNVPGTWSTVGFSGPCDAPTPPTVAQVAAIGGLFTVNLTADATVGGVDVHNTGTLIYTINGLNIGTELNFFRVQNGGVVEGDDPVFGQINFTGDAGGGTFEIQTGGSVAIDYFTLTGDVSGLNYLVGGGSLSIAQIHVDADDATLINDMTVPLLLNGFFEFTLTTTGATFINNGTFLAPELRFNSDNNFFINNSLAGVSVQIAAGAPGADNNTITNSAGAVLSFGDLNGDASLSSLDGGDITIENSGSINQTGTFLRIANSAGAFNDINNLAGATWNYEGTGHDTHLRLLANNGTNDFNYSGAGAQSIITPVAGNGYSNITLQAAGAKTALGNFSVFRDWSRTGAATFAPAGFTVTLSGTAASQSISAVGGETFSGLTFNNLFGSAPQITFNNPITVTGTLTMTSGRVNQNGNAFTLGSAGVASTLVRTASSTTNWMYGGSFTRHWLNGIAVSSTAGNLYGLFPVGTSGASSYRPVEINSSVAQTADGSFTVTHTDAAHTTDLSPVFDDGGINIVRKHNAQFNTSVSGATGGTYSIAATMTGLLAGNLADIRLAVSTGATTVTTVGTHQAATGSAPNPTASRTGVATAGLTGDFRISTTDAVNTPLPIELISLTGEVVENAIQLNWRTASELNNDFFTVERSATGESFSIVGTVEGAGTTSKSNRYNLIDHDPIPGQAYYRLRQTDFDGTFTYSKVIKVTYEEPLVAVMDVYPNPSHGDFTVRITGLKGEQSIPLVIVDPLGKTVMTFTLNVNPDSGTAHKTISLNGEWPQGIYFLKAGTAPTMSRRLVIAP